MAGQKVPKEIETKNLVAIEQEVPNKKEMVDIVIIDPEAQEEMKRQVIIGLVEAIKDQEVMIEIL